MATVQAPESLTITYCGHSCFFISWQPATGGKATILLDPFSDDTGYKQPDMKADVVLMSHNHFDHATLPPAGGRQVIKGLDEDGQWQVVQGKYGRLQVAGLASYHDPILGGDRGRNMMFILTMPPFTVAHLGDLGHRLSRDHIERLAGVDLLLIPVGGFYTIDAETAWEQVERIGPRIVVPMHYRTDNTEGWPISSVDDFVAGKQYHTQESPITITTDILPEETEIWVFSGR